MKANELRIGSIVKSLVNDEDFSIVEEIGHRASLGHYVSLNNQHSGVWLEHQERDLILGIPLTEEWLIKFGFGINKRPSKDIYIEFNPRMAILFNQGNVGEMDLVQDGKFISFKHGHIKYVHQLQNLYFALTNEELTMK